VTYSDNARLPLLESPTNLSQFQFPRPLAYPKIEVGSVEQSVERAFSLGLMIPIVAEELGSKSRKAYDIEE
jgi:hypothetical protein